MSYLASIALHVANALIGDTPTSENPNVKRALDRIASWEKTATQGKWTPKPTVVAKRLKELAANPGVIDQADPYGWCMPASFLYVMFKDFPIETTEFALSLYDTGAATLGGLAFSPDAKLMAFDFETYKTDGFLKVRPGQTLEGNAVDFMLLGSIVDAANDVIDFEGPIDDYGAHTSISNSFIEGLLNRTGFATEITEKSLRSVADVAQLIQHSQTRRIVLFGPVRSFSDQARGIGDHAAPLATPISLVNDQYQFRYWSSGASGNPPFAENSLTFKDQGAIRVRFDSFISVNWK